MVDNLTEKELLNYAIENGIIDINTIQKKIEMNERNKYLEKHESKVWQSTDGKWYTYIPDEMAKNGKKLVKRTTKDSLDDLIVESYKKLESEPYIRQVFDEWISDKLRYGEIQKQSYDRYKTDFDRFFKDAKIYKVKFRYITEDMLEDFIKSSIHDKQLTAKAWGGLRILINGIFKYAKKKGYTNISITNFMGDLDLSNNIFARKKKFKAEDSVFSDLEVSMLTNYINERDVSIINLGILLAFETGLRAGELSSLKWSDFNNKTLSVNKTEIRYRGEDGNYIYEVADSTKTAAGEREVILSDNAIAILRKIRSVNTFGEYIFMQDGKRIKAKGFTTKLKRMCERLKIKPKSAHKLRKTYATKLIDGGVDEWLVTDQLGHTDISTSKKYYYFHRKEEKYDREQIQKALNYG